MSRFCVYISTGGAFVRSRLCSGASSSILGIDLATSGYYFRIVVGLQAVRVT